MMLGFHCSIAGGMINAIDRAAEGRTDTLQVFTKNQRQWKDKSFTADEGDFFKSAMKKHGIKRAVSHCTYLINVASANLETREKSIESLTSEIERCQVLGIDYAVLHPGANKEISHEECCVIIAEGILKVLNATNKSNVKILLENTAGQGSSTGYKIEHLQMIIDLVKSDRVGICIDTCHAFAVGYDLREKKGVSDFFKTIDRLIGLEKLYAFHLNDSKGDFASRVDRHAHIGKGKIGLEVFSYIMNKFPHVPKIVETDHEQDQHLEDVRLLRTLLKK